MPARPFFPGDTPTSRNAPESGPLRSRWREDAFIYRQLQGAILPRYGLAQSLRNWHDIARGLADTPRRRTRQTARLSAILARPN